MIYNVYIPPSMMLGTYNGNVCLKEKRKAKWSVSAPYGSLNAFWKIRRDLQAEHFLGVMVTVSYSSLCPQSPICCLVHWNTPKVAYWICSGWMNMPYSVYTLSSALKVLLLERLLLILEYMPSCPHISDLELTTLTFATSEQERWQAEW